MKILSPLYLILTLLLFLSAPTFFAQTPPGFPTQPMIVHGEILVKGQNLQGTRVLEARVGSTTVAKAKINNQFGFSSYVLEIKKSPKISETSEVVLYLEDHALQDGRMKWMKGASVNQDFIINSTIQFRPKIVSARAVKDRKEWHLSAEFKPIQQEDITADALNYHLRWYFTPTNEEDEEAEPNLIQERTVSSSETEQTFSLEMGKIPDLTGFLHLVVTPLLNNGEKGPSVIQKIKTELKEAEM